MNQFVCLAFQITLIICALLFCCCEATSIRLSPLGMVSVCPEGQLLLTCERMSGSVLYWDVSVPHGATIQEQRTVLSQGALLSPEFRIGFTEFNITRTSDRPLTSQLLINNVTTEINGSTIYCSKDGNENNAPITVINVKYKDEFLRSMDHSLNVTMVNQLLRSDDVTVTLQWPREPGAVYHVNVSPQIPHIKVTNVMTVTINLTVSYNIQYNVNIVSSLCGITTSKVLNYVICNYPPIQSLHDPVVVVSGSQDSPPIEGQFITYTCPPGFILTGPNVSVCTGNREWEPDPGQVDCIADCGLPLVNRNLKLNYSSTLEGSVLILTCENEMSLNSTNEMILSVTCDSNGSWIPNPADFIQSCSPTTSPEIQTESGASGGVILGIVLAVVVLVLSVIVILIGISTVFGYKHYKQSCTRKNSRHNEGFQVPAGPLYEEIQPNSTPEHQDLVELQENVAYGPIVRI